MTRDVRGTIVNLSYKGQTTPEQTDRLIQLTEHPHEYPDYDVAFWKLTKSPRNQGPVSIPEKTRFVFRIVRSLWNLTGTSAAVLPMCLWNFKSIRQFKVPISWLRDFTRSYEKTSFRILRRGPARLRVLTVPFHGTCLPLEIHRVTMSHHWFW